MGNFTDQKIMLRQLANIKNNKEPSKIKEIESVDTSQEH
jgi:hypothetical protein